MARKVYFSFHYERDIWRVSQIRNSGAFRGVEKAGFYDKAEWESIQKTGEKAIKQWIDKQLDETSVTVVLIGAETATRKYVLYEIEQSIIRGNGLIGVYIHRCKGLDGKTDSQGRNPLPVGYPTYDWVDDNGYENMGKWVESAARRAGK